MRGSVSPAVSAWHAHCIASRSMRRRNLAFSDQSKMRSTQSDLVIEALVVSQGEAFVHLTATVATGAIAGVPPTSSLPEPLGNDITRCAWRATNSQPTADSDTSLLVAALEDIEARRKSIEWLLDADLLCMCLV